MKKLVLLLLLTSVLFSSNLLAQSLKGIYSGKYIFQTSDGTDEYNVIILFTDSTYQLEYSMSSFCEPHGRYSVSESNVLLDQLVHGCDGRSSTNEDNPFGLFSISQPTDSLILTQLIGDTLRDLRLADKTLDYKIVVSLGNIAEPSSQASVEIPVYVTNTSDTVAGFNFWIQLDRPDLLQFQITFDTTNTLLSGWELVEVNSLSGLGTDLNVVGIANLPDAPIANGILPQDGTIPLIKLKLDLLDFPKEFYERTTELLFQTDFIDHFGFSDPWGTSIGIVQEEVLDTLCYYCMEWINDDCIDWTMIPCYITPDSIEIVLDTVAYMDTTQVIAINGSVAVPECGNMNGFDNQVDVTDLLYIVDYMFLNPSGPAPFSSAVANVNSQDQFDISDLLLLVDYMFLPPGTVIICP